MAFNGHNRVEVIVIQITTTKKKWQSLKWSKSS